MKIATVHFTSTSSLCFGRFHNTPKLDREQPDAYEERTWRERLHYNEKSEDVFIPANAVRKCIQGAAKFLGSPVKGKGKSTYTKHFETGIMVLAPIVLPVKKDEVARLTLAVPSDGKPGGTTRVIRHFPIIHQWEGRTDVLIMDEIITQDVLSEHLYAAGQFIGLLTFRPRQREDKGRFEATVTAWSNFSK